MMRAIWAAAAAAAALAVTAAVGQQPVLPGQPAVRGEPIPVALALEDIAAAYASAPTAEIVTVKAVHRTLDRNESSTQSFVVRIEPDAAAGEVRRILLELGSLRAYFGEGELLVTSTSAADKYFRAEYRPPLTAATVQALLPPVPAPQIALADGVEQPISLTPYAEQVVFSSAQAYTQVRPALMVLEGSGPMGPATLTADVQSSRLLRLVSEVSGEQPASIELTCRAIDPGDTALWRPALENRARVGSLSQLRPSPPAPLRIGDRAPEINLSSTSPGIWSLSEALLRGPHDSVAIVFWRWSQAAERARAAAGNAAAGFAALRSAAGDSGGLLVVPAVVMELAEYSGAALEAANQHWRAAPGAGEEGGPLLWSNAASRSIEPYIPEADALAVVFGPGRVVRAIIPLDGAAGENGLLERILAALKGPDEGTTSEPQPAPDAPAGP